MLSFLMYAVIPTVVVGGMFALLSLLFPMICVGLLLFYRRWLVWLSVLGLNSTLYVIHLWFGNLFCFSPLGGELALWLLATLITLIGALWAWRRQRKAKEDFEWSVPNRSEWVVLGVLTLIGLGVIVYYLLMQKPVFATGLRWQFVVWIGCLAGFGYVLLHRPPGRGRKIRPLFSAEAVMLGAMALGSTAVTAASWLNESINSPMVRIGWTFLAPGEGSIASSPLVAGDRIFTAAAHRNGVVPYGALYCLDRDNGQLLWAFHDCGSMKQVYSSPCLVDGRLYIGEGFHMDSLCKLYCLDARTGHKLWDFRTKGHTESSPCVLGGRVYFGAGDDGLYCLDARTGQQLWHYEGPHVDATPAVEGNRVYSGSGYGRYEVFCLNTDTGTPVWRVPVWLPAFGSPRLDGEHVFYGIGNGNLVASDESPAGALLCLEGRTGKEVWRFPVPDAVHTKPAAEGDSIYFTSRDHCCYCLDRTRGRLRWVQSLGSPLVTAPVLTGKSRKRQTAKLYVVASEGCVWCLDPSTGVPYWAFDMAKQTLVLPPFLSSASVVIDQSAGKQSCRLYFGGSLISNLEDRPALFSLDEPSYERLMQAED